MGACLDLQGRNMAPGSPPGEDDKRVMEGAIKDASTSAPQQNWPDPRGCSPLKYPLHLFTRRISHLYCPVLTKTCYENSSLYSFIKCIGNWGTLACE